MNVIYKIRNTVNQKFYVGSTTDTRVRFQTHRRCLRGNRHHCKHLQAAWNKYGEECFKFEVVEEIPEGQSLQAAEDVWLKAHHGEKYCYNTGFRSDAPWRDAPVGSHPIFGKARTEEAAAKISATLKAYYAADPTNHPRYGKKHTEESKRKMVNKVIRKASFTTASARPSVTK